MTLPPLLRPSYWFDLTPAPFQMWLELTLLAIFAIFFFAGLAVRFLAMGKSVDKLKRRVMNRLSTSLVILGVFGIFLSALSYERIYALSMRAGFILWFALLAWFAYSFYRLWKIEAPALRKQWGERDALNKWLPTSNKK